MRAALADQLAGPSSSSASMTSHVCADDAVGGDGVLLLQLLHRRCGLAAVTAVDATDVRP
jgi:hypothetical protein